MTRFGDEFCRECCGGDHAEDDHEDDSKEADDDESFNQEEHPMKKSLCLLLCLAFLLAGCGANQNTNAPDPVKTPDPVAQTAGDAVPAAENASAADGADAAPADAAQAETAASGGEGSAAAGDVTEADVVEADGADAAAASGAEAASDEAAALPDGLVLSSVGPGGITESGAASGGVTVHTERTVREAYDPNTGTEKILTYSWDTVQVQSEQYPEAAAAMTDALAAMEEAWYNGNGEEGNAYFYGYGDTLAAAEDFYTAAQETGSTTMEFTSSRTVTALRADGEVVVFLVGYEYFGGGAHGSYQNEALCFDARTGAQLTLADLSSDEAALKAQLVSEMLALAAEDADGYYSGRLDLTDPADYETAFTALLREGSWYPGTDGFHLFSELYELGSYAAGITDFVIPYENLASVLDARWIPAAAELTAEPEFVAMENVPDGSVDIVDRVILGDGGGSWLLYCQGEARNLSLWTGAYDEIFEGFVPECQVFFTGSLKDAALQVAMEIPGDLPCAMLRYTDLNGLHERTVSLSGENGDLLLSEEETADGADTTLER